ncbi:hypothetical protein Tco_0615687, partial [Tanacetum coccineum]
MQAALTIIKTNEEMVYGNAARIMVATAQFNRTFNDVQIAFLQVSNVALPFNVFRTCQCTATDVSGVPICTQMKIKCGSTHLQNYVTKEVTSLKNVLLNLDEKVGSKFDRQGFDFVELIAMDTMGSWSTNAQSRPRMRETKLPNGSSNFLGNRAAGFRVFIDMEHQISPKDQARCNAQRGFLSQKGIRVGRGVKEKNVSDSNIKVVKDHAVPSVTVATGNMREENVGQSSTGPTTSQLGPDVSFASLLKESIFVVSERYANSSYGFFLGKRVAYPIVANYNPDVNLMKEDVVNVSVWVKLHGVPVTAFTEDGLSVIAMKI